MFIVSIARALRPQQWVKNLLLFLPMLLAHRLEEAPFLLTLKAFLLLSLASSVIYVINDLIDLESDRIHPEKKERPFASGKLSRWTGLCLIPVCLLLISLLSSLLLLPRLFLKGLLLYLGVGTAYSLYLKRFPIIDILLLTSFYTFRILLGGVVTETPVSPWLLAFSMFFFFNLALLKRFTELGKMKELNRAVAKGRGYAIVDIDLLGMAGLASGYLSVLVLALYINSSEVLILYRHPETLWLIGPFLLYWITRLWLLARRGTLSDDPISFAIKDPVSYAVGVVIVMMVVAAS